LSIILTAGVKPPALSRLFIWAFGILPRGRPRNQLQQRGPEGFVEHFLDSMRLMADVVMPPVLTRGLRDKRLFT
jgi:hypothetical protein